MKNRLQPQYWQPLYRNVPVKVWTVSVSSVLGTCGTAGLSDAERDRAGRFRREEDSRRFRASRLLLREVLGRHLLTRPGDLQLEKAPGGRLSVVLPPGFPPVFFSLSRSGDFCTVALSGSAEVGVDIEKTREFPGWEAVAQAWLSKGERSAIRALVGESSRTEAFFRLWCAREAAAKALGLGLALDPRSAGSLEGILEGWQVVAVFGGRTVEVAEMEAPQGYRLAVASVA